MSSLGDRLDSAPLPDSSGAEARAWADMYAAAPADWAASAGVGSREVGGALVLSWAATGAALLEPHGWRVARACGEVTYWKRPGKDGPGWSATTGRCRNEQSGELLYVFSGNASPFEPAHAYSKFATCALLNHAADFKAAAKALAEQG